MPARQHGLIDADDRAQRIARRALLEIDGVHRRLVGFEHELAELCAIPERKQHLAVGAQLSGHDVEQAGVDAEDGDKCLLVADVPEHAECVAAELLHPEQHQLRIARDEHVRAIDPTLVELERFRIGRADHRTVRIDETDVLCVAAGLVGPL